MHAGDLAARQWHRGTARKRLLTVGRGGELRLVAPPGGTNLEFQIEPRSIGTHGPSARGEPAGSGERTQRNVYSELRPDRILETLDSLQQRVDESFPGSGLSRVTRELRSLADTAGPTAEWLSRPIWPLRIGTVLGITGILGVTFGFARLATGVSLRVEGVAELIQASEAAANEIILVSLALFFFMSLETRVKRGRALAALHRLRSLVHIVDMHQLTKDPQQLLAPGPTSAAKRSYTRFELARYLDFCSELLSLASKLAALHIQYLNDPVVLAAVNDIEALAGGLSNKIWQKIMILDVMAPVQSERKGRVTGRRQDPGAARRQAAWRRAVPAGLRRNRGIGKQTARCGGTRLEE